MRMKYIIKLSVCKSFEIKKGRIFYLYMDVYTSPIIFFDSFFA